jgi:hypothetical protein
MRRNTLGISQGAASIVALAATAIIVATALSAQLPSLYFVQAAGSQEVGEAEKLAGVKLSLVAVLDDGTVIVSNDGTRPVTMDRLYTQDSVVSLTSPITLQPGQKASINLGTQPEVLAIGLPNGNKVVLKEKPHVRITSMTTSVNPTSTTRISPTTSTTTSTSRTTTTTTTTSSTTWTTSMPTTSRTTTTYPTTTYTSSTTTSTSWPTITTSTTTYSTTYTPLTVTYWSALATPAYGTMALYTYLFYQFYSYCFTTYTYHYTSTVYTDTSVWGTGVSETTTTATVNVRSMTTISLNTATTPNMMYHVTSVVTTRPSPTITWTQVSYYWLYRYNVYYTSWSYSYASQTYGNCYAYYYHYIFTTYWTYLYHRSPTVTLTTVTVS